MYEGEFKEDKRQRKGFMVWPDGSNYVGDFVEGRREGYGVYTFSDGGNYAGEWVNGRYQGYGECTWVDGRIYKGQWKDGKAHGEGTEWHPDGSIRHKGQWVQDEPVQTEEHPASLANTLARITEENEPQGDDVAQFARSMIQSQLAKVNGDAEHEREVIDAVRKVGDQSEGTSSYFTVAQFKNSLMKSSEISCPMIEAILTRIVLERKFDAPDWKVDISFTDKSGVYDDGVRRFRFTGKNKTDNDEAEYYA